MNPYLARLKATKSEKCPAPSLTELTKAPSVSFVSATPAHFQEIAPDPLAALPPTVAAMVRDFCRIVGKAPDAELVADLSELLRADTCTAADIQTAIDGLLAEGVNRAP